MGWSSFEEDADPRMFLDAELTVTLEQNQAALEQLREHLGYRVFDDGKRIRVKVDLPDAHTYSRVLRSAIVDNVYYAAIECVDVNTGKRTVHAEVCAIRRDDEFTGKLFWKQMHEPGKVLLPCHRRTAILAGKPERGVCVLICVLLAKLNMVHVVQILF
jgi:hypothetical protein